jgi:uncharacterized membrane protein YtjA (UPF0391 family)
MPRHTARKAAGMPPETGIGADAQSGQPRRMSLLKWALVFFVISIVAAVLGFGGISAAAADVAKVLFFIFIAIAALLVIAGVAFYRRVT